MTHTTFGFWMMLRSLTRWLKHVASAVPPGLTGVSTASKGRTVIPFCFSGVVAIIAYESRKFFSKSLPTFVMIDSG